MPCELCDDGLAIGACGYCGASLVVGGVTRPMPKSKAEDLEEWDRRMAEAVAKVPKVNARGQRGAAHPAETLPSASADTPETSTPSSDAPYSPAPAGGTAPRPKGRRPRKPRRSAIQLQRAAEQEQREAMLRVERATRGTYLEGALDDEDRWAASLRDAEND